jgi:hypothetical protein
VPQPDPPDAIELRRLNPVPILAKPLLSPDTILGSAVLAGAGAATPDPKAERTPNAGLLDGSDGPLAPEKPKDDLPVLPNPDGFWDDA